MLTSRSGVPANPTCVADIESDTNWVYWVCTLQVLHADGLDFCVADLQEVNLDELRRFIPNAFLTECSCDTIQVVSWSLPSSWNGCGFPLWSNIKIKYCDCGGSIWATIIISRSSSRGYHIRWGQTGATRRVLELTLSAITFITIRLVSIPPESIGCALCTCTTTRSELLPCLVQVSVFLLLHWCTSLPFECPF